MIKYIILAIITNAFLAITILTGPEVHMQINAPSVIEAGSVVDVEIELYKDQITGFARFQQELPYGVTATPVYPADMNFYFEENTIKMIWLNLPREEKITIQYRLHICEKLKGDLQLDGTFSYIENNQRRSTRTPGKILAIKPSPKIDKRYIVDVNKANRKLLAPTPLVDPGGDIFAVRQDPVPDNDTGYIVNILVIKEGKNHFAKIEDIIPEGYTASEMESQGGIFSFSDQKARIIWKNLPPENNFIAKYRLIPDEETIGIPEVSGEFSFMHNDITASRKIIQKDDDLGSLNENDKNQLIASIKTSKANPVDITNTPYDPRPAATSSEPGSAFAGQIAESDNSLQSKPVVYYRVQLAAGHKSVDVRQYFSRLNITDDVQTEMHEGWIKYSTGPYDNYRSARDYRVHIWNTTPVDDAFVAAYNDGSRITVQEALMIANHQWYR